MATNRGASMQNHYITPELDRQLHWPVRGGIPRAVGKLTNAKTRDQDLHQ